MKRNSNKLSYIERAEKWITSGNDEHLAYASLELRMCLEILVYEKLELYSKCVPGVVFSKWQLTHAMKMLTQFEPDADSSFKLAIATESDTGIRSGPFESLGEHRFFLVKWLNKNYNKLGNHLHVTREKDNAPADSKIRADLKAMAEEIREAVECNIRGFALAERVCFTCELCDTKCMANADTMRKTHTAFCINHNCGAEYRIERVEDGYKIRLAQTDFECLKCGKINYFDNEKIRLRDGSMYGVLHLDSGELRCDPYEKFLHSIVVSDDASLLRDFTLTVGVVSNHGNWFTSDDHNKELKVLAQAYDWLLFLSDAGLSSFVESLLVKPVKRYQPIREAFVQSYTGKKGGNRFTKVKISLEADLALQDYFSKNLSNVESWFNVISPAGRSIAELKRELSLLASKNWKKILA